MATKIVWGYVDEDGNVQSGSGDFTVSEESEPGFYDIFFNPGTFSSQPAITGSCVSSSREAPVFQVYQLNGNKGFIVETRDAHSGDRDARAFMFTAVGGD
ncbi:MAG: hypothetical protein N838_02465 [Thiohalocapsa sp. PB-PSB1]|jgi:hypothetical protein|nr:MAG: hypothetical protein N838_29530 [Thiohalocapsa sp. PB-PSB1]QQO52417.1 MAG: hypothetical protein N838_02465 [Thiohalocapsa sp. PB-PSB1]HCS88633.1 hypothetical protein [Chromatiaceae bacterium]